MSPTFEDARVVFEKLLRSRAAEHRRKANEDLKTCPDKELTRADECDACADLVAAAPEKP